MTDPTTYQGRVLLVVGGGSGIGAEVCTLAAQGGAKVVIADINHAETLAASLSEAGGEVIYQHVDVRNELSVRTLMQTVVQHFGRLDGLLNAAGIPGSRSSLLDYDIGEFEEVLSVNLLGLVTCCKHAVPTMEASGGGRIVNIASIAGEIGFPVNPAYAASKAGVISVTKSLAADLAIRHTPVQVNALCPGWTDTPFLDNLKQDPGRLQSLCDSVPSGRLATSWEVARAALWMVMDAPWYLNGESIRVDGGLLSSSPTHVRMMREAMAQRDEVVNG